METRERFWAKVDKSGECWLWRATTTTNGYGQFFRDGKLVQAHRFAFEDARGPIPTGMEIDHLCRVRACVRPDHLEPVSHRENLMRGNGSAALRARQTECLRGHPLEGPNLIVLTTGYRQCRTCSLARKAAQSRAYRLRVKAAANG